MAGELSTPISLSERPGVSSSQRDKLPRWLFLSLLFHAVLIACLFIAPLLPSRRDYAPPVYTVDLVGGEKIGGNKIGTELQPKAAPKEVAKNTAAEPAPAPPETKKKEEKKEAKKEKAEKPEKAEKAKPAEKAVALPEKAPAKKEPPKKEAVAETKRDTKSEEGALDSVRERILQSAVERAKARSESAQKGAPKGEVLSTGPGEGEGAAALGVGGRGGGVVKGMDFIIYKNRMDDTFKKNWVWPGQRSNVKLKVTVHFTIKDTGEIVGVKIVQPSGDPAYDDSVVRAVRKSSPLPPVPEGLRKDFSEIEYTFRPEDLGA